MSPGYLSTLDRMDCRRGKEGRNRVRFLMVQIIVKEEAPGGLETKLRATLSLLRAERTGRWSRAGAEC